MLRSACAHVHHVFESHLRRPGTYISTTRTRACSPTAGDLGLVLGSHVRPGGSQKCVCGRVLSAIGKPRVGASVPGSWRLPRCRSAPSHVPHVRCCGTSPPAPRPHPSAEPPLQPFLGLGWPRLTCAQLGFSLFYGVQTHTPRPSALSSSHTQTCRASPCRGPRPTATAPACGSSSSPSRWSAS